MTFRHRLLLTFVTLSVAPLVVLALGVRRETGRRLRAAYEARVAGRVALMRRDLAAESDAIAARLTDVRAALVADNRVRAALVGVPGFGRSELLDWGGRAMRLAGLDLLQLQDSSGRILSSGHFRNEFDRVVPGIPLGLVAARAPEGTILAGRTPAGPFLALARVDSLRIGGRRFYLVAGRAIDAARLTTLAGDSDVVVRLETPAMALGDAVLPGDGVRAAIGLPFVSDSGAGAPAHLVVAASVAPLATVRRGIDLWFLAAVTITAAAAAAIAWRFAARLSAPLTSLSAKTGAVDLDRLDVDFAAESARPDEIGALARLLSAMTGRLRAGAARLRDAERQAAIGDIARQVNHDVKNGLIPIRNVLRHFAEVVERDPARLPALYGERRGTLEQGVAYLEALAANYARLSPRMDSGRCDVNAVARDAVRDTAVHPGLVLATRLAEDAPVVAGDAVVVRRILENLMRNAIDSLGTGAGTVTVATERHDGVVQVSVSDTGPGMTRGELDQAFQDFYTTKPGGTGLGLSIVRRLTLDLHGAVRVETAPGRGTTFRVELPVAGSAV